MHDGTAISSAPANAHGDTLASRPDLGAAMLALRQALKTHRRLPDRLIELMRLRVAFRNQCRPCMSMRYSDAVDDGLTEAVVCSLERPQEASDMTAAEKAAVAYADQFATDHLSIDHQKDALTKYFTSEEIAEIAMNVAFFVGFGRLGAVFDDGSALPVGERRTDGEMLAPWRLNGPTLSATPPT
jgi:AhpD family alkylhydroperoxidase